MTVRQYLLAGIMAPLLACGALAQDGDLDLGSDAALTATPAQTRTDGETLNNTLFGDWMVSCEAVSVSRVACSLRQQLTLADTDQLIVQMVAVPAEGDSAILLAQVPMGAYLPAGAVYRFDNENEDEEQRSMVWQRCLGGLCEAAIQLDAEELAQFAANDRLLFGYRPDIGAEPLIVALDISRFNEALAAIRADDPGQGQGQD